MRACVVLDVGVIADCVILRRADRESDFKQTTAPLFIQCSRSTVAAAGLLPTREDFFESNPLTPPALSGEHSLVLSNSSTPRAAVSPRAFGSTAALDAMRQTEAVHYIVRTSLHPHVDLIAHEMDIVPFGFTSPSAVFAVRGRHVNLGLSRMVLEDGGALIERHVAPQLKEKSLAPLIPTPQKHLVSKLPEMQEKARLTRAEREGGPVSPLAAAIASLKANTGVSTHNISELQLLPMLSAAKPILPLPVGASIKCRRCGNSTRLFAATVLSARYDCTYVVKYESDSVVERGVLHNDVLLLSDKGAEDIRVRDSVTFMVLRSKGAVHGDGVVTSTPGGRKYMVYGNLHNDDEPAASSSHSFEDQQRGRTETPPSRIEEEDSLSYASSAGRYTFTGVPGLTQPTPSVPTSQYKLYLLPRDNIVHIAPHYSEALYSNHGGTLLPIFRMLDEEGAGTVAWVAVVKFFSQSEYAGQPLTPSDWGMLHREVVSRHGAVRRAAPEHRSGLAGADAAVLDTQLTFSDFELVANRILNMKW
jgi:hypothetical protein